MTFNFRRVVTTCVLSVIALYHLQSHAQPAANPFDPLAIHRTLDQVVQGAPPPDRLALYRKLDCTVLREQRLGLAESFRQGDAFQPTLTGNRRVDRGVPEALAEWEQTKLLVRAALTQVMLEKQCDNPQAAAQPVVTARTGAPAQVPAAPPAAGMLPQIGAKVDIVSPGFAQSLGLKQAGGALVIEAEAGSPAQKAGLQALDVIVEITGQKVQNPADLQESLSRMRPGFKAALRVWRNKAMRDVVVTIADVPLAPAVATARTEQPPVVGSTQAGSTSAKGGAFGVQISSAANSPLSPAMAALFRTTAGKGTPLLGVTPGSAAEKAGLQQMDVLIEIDGKPVSTPSDMLRIAAALPVGQMVDLVVLRQGATQRFRGATSLEVLTPKLLPPGTRGVCFTMAELSGVTFVSKYFYHAGGAGPAPAQEIANAESEFRAFLGKHLNADPSVAIVQTQCGPSPDALNVVINKLWNAPSNVGGVKVGLDWRPFGQ